MKYRVTATRITEYEVDASVCDTNLTTLLAGENTEEPDYCRTCGKRAVETTPA